MKDCLRERQWRLSQRRAAFGGLLACQWWGSISAMGFLEDAILLLEAVGGGMWTSLCRYCSNTSVEKRHHDIRRGGMNQKGDMCTSTDLLTRYCNVINIVKGYEHLERSLR